MFASLEEISWGQRIFNIRAPDYFKEHNSQGEFSIHNLDIVQPFLHETYMLVGLMGSSMWIILRRVKRNKRHYAVEYLVPDWYLSSYFFFVTCIYVYFDFFRGPAVNRLGMEFFRTGVFFVMRDQEPTELLLSLGFLLLMVINKYRQIKYA